MTWNSISIQSQGAPILSYSPILIALGGNAPSSAGSPDATLRAALAALEEDGAVQVAAVSRFFATPAFPAGSGPDFVNAAARIVTDLDPDALLQRLHAVEAKFGRERTRRWGQRTLDLDLLAAGDAILPDRETFDAWIALPPDRQSTLAPDRLILPHPRLQDRAFVLIPLADIAPDWRHPVTQKNVTQMLDALPAADKASVRAL